MLRSLAGIALLLAGLFVLVRWWPSGTGAEPPAAPDHTATATLALVPPSSPAVIPAPTVRPIPEGYRLRIVRLGIDLPIAEGDIARDVDMQQTPEGAAFHLPGSAIPGEVGNSYLYAHARAGMFIGLWDARVNDEVVVRAPDGSELRYVVSEVRPSVPPSDVSVALPTQDERLTLQTSTGPDADDPRFVVIARRS